MSEQKTNVLPGRDEIDAKYKWKLEHIYKENAQWEEDYLRAKELAAKMNSFHGRLAEGASVVYEALTCSDELGALSDKLFVYARMRKDEDNANSVYQALADRAAALLVEVGGACAFISPEISALPEETLAQYIDIVPDLKLYKFFFDEILRMKKHILSDREEELLALSQEVASASHDIFTMFNNADIRFGNIRDENGNEVEVTKARYIQLMECDDRRVREDAFKALYQTYIKSRNTLSATLSSSVKADCFYARVRQYPSALEASLNDDNVPVSVYENLIQTINNHIPLMHRYTSLRTKALGVEKLHMYDMFAPMVKETRMNVEYPEATDMVLDAVKPLGEQYVADLKQGLSDGWVDVFENRGKTGGAYSWGSYLTHPYVLLNYQNSIKDAFTVAHELGHAMHSFYSNRTQPYVYSAYRIFVAEVASTVNESLLMHHLLSKVKEKNERAYLINHYLEEFRGTVFRQVMFAEFERDIHAMWEKGEPLTADVLSAHYRALNRKYFGESVELDAQIDMEWSRIPHFYNAFYVYKYATGFSAAVALSQAVIDEGAPAAQRYIEFLSSGGSDYPIELLKKAGVDLTTSKPIEDALKVFETFMDELEGLL